MYPCERTLTRLFLPVCGRFCRMKRCAGRCRPSSHGAGGCMLVAAGKAAWQMARAAVETLGRVDGGVVITKYGHVKGALPGVTCCEAGHPLPDANGFAATEQALALVRGLTAADTVLFLLSGGGSALFEQPLLPATELQDITKSAAGLRGGYCRDEHSPQAAFGREGWAVRPGVRPRAGVQHRAERHSRRPAGYDRQRPGVRRIPPPAPRRWPWRKSTI